MDDGRNGGQNHSLAKRIGGEARLISGSDQRQMDSSAGVQYTRPGRCLLRPECACMSAAATGVASQVACRDDLAGGCTEGRF
jgi:hypothetical protein